MEQIICVNGRERVVSGDPRRGLLGVLREELGLTGTKYGCGEAQCGACVVLIDGEPAPACATAVGTVGDAEITTIEGLEKDGRLHPVQDAFLACDALQCGYCTPGMIMAAVALYEQSADPTATEAIQALDKHLCRCGTYRRILKAIHRTRLGSTISDVDEIPRVLSEGSDRQAGHVDHEEHHCDPESNSDSSVSPAAARIASDMFRLYGDGIVVLTERVSEFPVPDDFDVWLHMGAGGRATVCAGKAEVGQNIRTALAQAAADELGIALSNIDVVLGDTDLTPFDMGTFGSRSTPVTAPQVRRAAAAVHSLLKASARPSAPPCVTRVVRQEISITPARQWQLAGVSAAKLGARDFVTGRHRFASDLSSEAMLIGKVLRPPAFGAEIDFLDLASAQAVPGVTVVREGNFIGVAGESRGLAEHAISEIKATWRSPQAAPVSDIETLLRPTATRFYPAPSTAAITIEATYTTAYIAHVPLEPRAALADWKAEKLTVWTGTQRPFGVREALAIEFGIPERNVRVIVPDTGSGYGGKHTGEAAIEAARLSRAAKRPVKVAWTREEEFQYAYLRPAGVIDVRASTHEDGILADWQFDNYNSGAAGIQMPYEVASRRIEFHEVDPPLRQGSYRALAATANNFARECHVDDLARAAGIDPLAFRLLNLNDDRMCAVLSVAAERFASDMPERLPGRGYGIACGAEKGSYVANCVEVSIGSDGVLKLVRIVVAYECGAIVNPMHLENQVEGAVVMGIGGALFERIEFDRGQILNPRLSEYRVPRFSDVPPIEVVLLDRKDLPSAGAGETPIIAIAPAIGNAIFDATGVRLRSLPMSLRDFDQPSRGEES